MPTLLNRLNLTDLDLTDGDLSLDYNLVTLAYDCKTVVGENEIRYSIQRAILTSPLIYQRWVRGNPEVKIQDVEYGNASYALLSQPTINVLPKIEATIRDALKPEDRISIQAVRLTNTEERVGVVISYKLKDNRELELEVNG